MDCDIYDNCHYGYFPNAHCDLCLRIRWWKAPGKQINKGKKKTIFVKVFKNMLCDNPWILYLGCCCADSFYLMELLKIRPDSRHIGFKIHRTNAIIINLSGFDWIIRSNCIKIIENCYFIEIRKIELSWYFGTCCQFPYICDMFDILYWLVVLCFVWRGWNTCSSYGFDQWIFGKTNLGILIDFPQKFL